MHTRLLQHWHFDLDRGVWRHYLVALPLRPLRFSTVLAWHVSQAGHVFEIFGDPLDRSSPQNLVWHIADTSAVDRAVDLDAML